MNISEAVRKDSGVHPGDGTIGRERQAWYAVGTLNVGSGSLQVADLGGTSSIEVPLPAGAYRVDAKLIDFGGSLCLSRIRLLLDGATAVAEEKRGDVSVDFGGLVICDFQQIQDQLRPAERDEFDELLPAFMTTFCDMCRLNFESGKIDFVVCKAGIGTLRKLETPESKTVMPFGPQKGQEVTMRAKRTLKFHVSKAARDGVFGSTGTAARDSG